MDMNSDQVLARLLEKVEVLPVIEAQVGRIEAKLDRLNGVVGGHDARLAVLEEWKRCQGEPSAKATQDLRVEMAKMAALGGSAGIVIALVLQIINSLGF